MKIAMLGDAGSVNTQNWMQGLQEAGAEVICWTMPVRSNYRKAIFFFFDFLNLQKWIKNNKPDILIGYRTTSYGFIGALTGHRPLVIAAQAIDDVSSKVKWIKFFAHFFARYAVAKADLIHAWSPNMVPALMKRGAEEQKILVLPRGIDLRNFSFQQRDFTKKQIRIIVTRSLYPEYHIDAIIDAIAILVHREKRLEIQLTIAGSGPLEPSLKAQCSRLGLENHINFIGKVPNQEIPNYLQQHDYYVAVPDTEGASASLFEVFACGLFPVVSDLPGNRIWIEDGHNGLLVPSIDAECLANQLLFALNDTDRSAKAVGMNRKTAEEGLSLQKNMKAFIRQYEQLLKASKH